MVGRDIDREPMLEMYLFETHQLMEQLEGIIIKCEQAAKLEASSINEIFRIMHTIKSSSAMMMFNHLANVAHSLEDLFFFIRENKNVRFNFEALSDLVLTGIDFINGEIGKIENGMEADRPSEQLIARIKTYLEQVKVLNSDEALIIPEDTREKEKPRYYISKYESISEQAGAKYSLRLFFEEDCKMENVRGYTVLHNLEEIAQETYHLPTDILDNHESAEIIKQNGFLICFRSASPMEDIEQLLKQTMFLRKMEFSQVEEYPDEIKRLIKPQTICLGEADELQIKHPTFSTSVGEPDGFSVVASKQQSIISVNISKLDMLMNLVGEIVISEAMVTRNPDLDGLQLDSFQKAARQLKKLTTELQDIVMSVRMVPVAATFGKMNRIVRDMSHRLDKDVELILVGENTEVDKNIIDHLSDPLMHLIRNAMDHGLEPKEDRVAAGKSRKGKLTLEARNAGGDVLIAVRDDGKGLNRDTILAKAREQGLVNKPENELTDKEIFNYILLPGFSTKDKVTEFSGRGVGMDVVRKNIEKVGGSISIESVLGQGTEIWIKIPLTLAIIDGIEVAVGKAKYTIPTTSIRESFRVKESEVIADSEGKEIIMIRGRCYPIFRIHRLFNIKDACMSISDGIMVVIESEARTACLFVDRLIDKQQVVVKALPGYIRKVRGIAGCTIRGDGNISLILDVNGILEKEM